MDWRRELMGGLSSGIDMNNYLTIEALEDGLTVSLSTNACQYCVDGDGGWKTLAAGTATETINTGQTLSFRGNLTPASSKGIGTFTISKKCNLLGNCMSMLFKDNAANNYSLSGKNYAFYKLFDNCTNIVNVSKNFLPATTLASYCYKYMFRSCTSLTTAPELPATTLASYCYEYMFNGCTNLTTAPELPATTLANNCYYRMFNGCSSLTTAPELPATTLIYSCYNNMFSNCTSLTTAPELPATALANYCYSYMFYNCTKLKYIKMLATDISATNCLYYWVSGVSSTGTFVKNPAMTTLPTGAHGIPSGWTVINDGEESGGGQFYVNCDRYYDQFTFTIDSPKTWNECIGLKDDTGVYEITYEEVFPESGLYRFFITNNKYWYGIETDEDGNTLTPEDLIKIGTTYNAFMI